MQRTPKWVDRRCCDWDTFLGSVMKACQKLGFPLILVNWCEARRYWRTYSCTGADIIRMQRSRELNLAAYLYSTPRPRKRTDDD